VLGLERLYMSVIPANAASRRLFEKLGYEIDDSADARDYADEETDVTMSIARAPFEARWRDEIAALRMFERLPVM
jgi:RimJ/RimL family protein N-acetyltransferase